VQPPDPVDGEIGAADTLDLRPHGDQQIAQIDNLGLACGVEQAAAAVRQHRRHHRILGRPDRDNRKIELAAGQPAIGRNRANIPLCKFDSGTESLERLEMQANRAITDRAATRHRHRRLAHARQHRAQYQDRGAHLAHQIIGRDRRGDSRRLQAHYAAEILWPRALNHRGDAKLVHQVLEPVDIGQARQVPERQRLLGQERAGDECKRSILGPGNRNRAFESVAAADDEFVHFLPLANLGCRANEQAHETGGSHACR